VILNLLRERHNARVKGHELTTVVFGLRRLKVSAIMQETMQISRTGKQCRERFNHHVAEGLSKGTVCDSLVRCHTLRVWQLCSFKALAARAYVPKKVSLAQVTMHHTNELCSCLFLLPAPFTAEEDAIIVAQQRRIGNKWAVIAKSLPGRTDNAVKNRWNTVLLRQQLEAHAAAECGALAVGSMELANGKRQDCLLSAVLACPLLPDEWSGAVVDTDRDWSHDTYDRTNTTESTLTHFSASNSPTNQWGPLTEDSDMVIQGLGRHTYQHDADAETASELTLSPCPVSLKMETCFKAVGQAASSLSLQSRDVRWSAPRTLRTTPEAHASASIQKQWLQEGEEGCLTTPLSPRAHVLHTSVLSKLFQQSKALIGGGEALALKLVSGEALGLKAGEKAEEALGLTADEEPLGLKLSSRVPVRPTPAQPLTQTHAVAASAHVKDSVAASAHGGIATSEMCESFCYAVAHKSARAELARHSGARWTPKTLLQTPVQASAASKRRQIAQLHAHAFALAHAQNHVKRDSARQRSEEVGTQGGVYGFRAIFCFCKNK